MQVLHAYFECHAGLLKQHLKTEDFIRCARSDAPENTLLLISTPCQMDDLTRYIDLVVSFFATSPQGSEYACVCTHSCV